MKTLKIGSTVKVSPDITGESTWIDAEVKDIKNNPFNGVVVYAQALKNQIIYFNKAKYFKLS